MKTVAVIFILLVSSITHYGQSHSFQTLKETFGQDENVMAVQLRGFAFRTIMMLAGENDFKKEIGSLKSIRFITIPRSSLKDRNLKIGGFRKVLERDEYQELASSREGSEKITVYINDAKQRDALYFFLIENPTEIMAVEIRGAIDINSIINNRSSIKLSNL